MSLNTIYGGSTSATIDYNHGSAVASIIAAVKDNNLQIAGIAPKSKIMDVKFENNDEPLITLSKIASGISWAWQNGADVINNSWGFLEEPNLNSSLLENAINDAITLGRNGKGTLVIFGAGNYSDNITYPANFNDDIITVGAVDSDALRWDDTPGEPGNWQSSYGEKLDLVAPGVNISVPYYNSTIQTVTGT